MDNILAHILATTEAKPTGSDQWLGHCRAHGSKKHRDLSIKLNDNKILLHCFAACPKEEVVSALGLTVQDLFTDTLESDPRKRRAAVEQRDRQRQQRERQAQQEGALIDALREADYFLQSRRGLDISAWSNEKLNDELNALADAYFLLEKENLDGQLG